MSKDLIDAATWYDSHRQGLGIEFIDEVVRVFESLAVNPLLNCPHPLKNIRWRYPNRFPYKIIYELNEDDETVIVACVVHGARNDSIRRKRLILVEDMQRRSMINWDDIRKEFPVTENSTYLNSAAAGPLSRATVGGGD